MITVKKLFSYAMMMNDSSHFQRKVVNVQELPPLHDDILSIEVGNLFRVVNSVVLCSLIGLFGIAANVINMTVFYKQGFTTTTNISFFALAISDMGCLITVQWFDICWNPYLEKADINFVPEDVVYLSGDWFHICFGRVTIWITVFITAERFIGITLPLKVREIITLRRTKVTMCFLFVINFAFLLPEYSIAYWDWKFVPARNRTLLGLVYRSYKDKLQGLSFTIISFSGFLSFICIILLTVFLVIKLQRKSKWRKQVTGGAESSEASSTRDKKTVKMIIIIAIILIVCYFPGTVLLLVSTFVPEFMIDGAYSSSFYAFWSLVYVFNVINSSINVFLYYTMSSKYRQTFNDIYARNKKTDPH